MCFLYLILVKKVNYYFLIVLQRFSQTIFKLVKSDAFFDFKFKIPSKVVFNLIIIEMINLVKSLDVIKDFKFNSFSKRQTKYSLLRSPFIYKKSQEQLCFDLYAGSFSVSLYKRNSLILEYSEIFFMNRLKKVNLLDITVLRNLKAIS